jgi:hypothetical protein
MTSALGSPNCSWLSLKAQASLRQRPLVRTRHVVCIFRVDDLFVRRTSQARGAGWPSALRLSPRVPTRRVLVEHAFGQRLSEAVHYQGDVGLFEGASGTGAGKVRTEE